MNAADAIAFVAGNVAAVAIAMAVALRSVPERSSVALRIAAAISAYILLVSLLTLLLGCVGLLDAHIAAGLLIVPAIGAAFTLKHQRDKHRGPVLVEPRRLLDWSPLLPIAIGLSTWWLVRNLALGTYITNDDKTYHAAIIAQWLSDGRFSIVGTTYQAYFPLNGELLSLWYLLPFGHDGAVPLNGLVYLALFVSLSLHFADRLGVAERWQLLPAILVLASTPTFFGITSFTDLDFSPPVMVLASTAFLLAAVEKPSRSPRWALALLGGACAGFAVGMKVSFVPPVGLLCLIFAGVALKRFAFSKALAACLLVAVAVIGAGAYWYLRNWAITGNPVYPAAAGPFEGPFGSADQNATKLTTVLGAGLDSSQWRQLLEGFFNRPYTIALVVLAGWIGGLAILLRRKLLSADQSLIVLSLIACSAAATAFFPITPFSGTNEVGGLESTGRYLNLLYLAGGLLAVLLSSRLPALDTVPRRLIALAIGMLAFTLPFTMAFSLPIAIAILGVTVIAFAGIEIAPRLPGLRFPMFRLAPLLLPILALVSVPLNLRSTDRVANDANPLVAAIEALPAGSEIAHFNGWLYQGYALAGRRQQHQPVRLLGDGRRYTPMHTRGDERAPDEDFWSYERHHSETALQATRLVDNLRAAGVDFLLTSPHPDGDWPPQHGLLQSSGAFEKLSTKEQEKVVVWDLRTAPAESKVDAKPTSP